MFFWNASALNASKPDPLPANRGERTRLVTKRREPKGIIFKRGAIAAYVVQRLHSKPTFGQTQLAKVMHLTQAHLGIDLALEFKRHMAGPLDEAIYKMEGFAKKQGWFVPKGKKNEKATYTPGPNIADRIEAANSILGSQQAGMDDLLSHIEKMNTDRAELFFYHLRFLE